MSEKKIIVIISAGTPQSVIEEIERVSSTSRLACSVVVSDTPQDIIPQGSIGLLNIEEPEPFIQDEFKPMTENMGRRFDGTLKRR